MTKISNYICYQDNLFMFIAIPNETSLPLPLFGKSIAIGIPTKMAF